MTTTNRKMDKFCACNCGANSPLAPVLNQSDVDGPVQKLPELHTGFYRRISSLYNDINTSLSSTENTPPDAAYSQIASPWQYKIGRLLSFCA